MNICVRTIAEDFFLRNIKSFSSKTAKHCRFAWPKGHFLRFLQRFRIFPYFRFCPIWCVQKIIQDPLKISRRLRISVVSSTNLDFSRAQRLDAGLAYSEGIWRLAAVVRCSRSANPESVALRGLQTGGETPGWTKIQACAIKYHTGPV